MLNLPEQARWTTEACLKSIHHTLLSSLLMINMLIYIDQYKFCDGKLHSFKHLSLE